MKLEYHLDFKKSEYLFEHHPEANDLVWMSPEDFIALSMPIIEQPDRINELMDLMVQEVPIDPLYFDIDAVTGEIISHEGRHRAYAAKRLGIREVPVIIYYKVWDKHAGYFDTGGYAFLPKTSSLCRYKAKGSKIEGLISQRQYERDKNKREFGQKKEEYERLRREREEREEREEESDEEFRRKLIRYKISHLHDE